MSLPARFCQRNTTIGTADRERTTHVEVTAGPYALRLHGARPPGLVLVREPDELGLERAHPQLALRARLLELAEPNRHVAADDDWMPARLDEDALVPVRVPGRRQQADSR